MVEDAQSQQRTNREISNANLIPFKKGEVSNPKGRPPKNICITTLVKEMLLELAPGTENNPKTYAELIARAILQESVKGNIQALRELLDRIEGKVTQPIDMERDIILNFFPAQKGG